MRAPTPRGSTRILSTQTTTRTTEQDGMESTVIVETTKKLEKATEPDYIKLYTRMWCEFNGIPECHRALFLELATRMSYCNKSDLGTSQIVYTGEPNATAICQAIGWKQKDSLMKGLKALVNCGAIRKVNRAVYQINPSYAGRGEWKYNPKLDRGGVEDFIARFDLRKGTVETQIVWSTTEDENLGNIDSIVVSESVPKKAPIA